MIFRRWSWTGIHGQCRLLKVRTAMPNPLKRLHIQGIVTRRTMNQLTTGGDWAARLTNDGRQNLKWFWFDGFFASASENIIGTYLVVFLLAIGASQAQIGLLSSLSSLSAALMLLPGALLVERLGRRKDITVLGGGIGARLTVFCLALLPLMLDGPALIFVAIALAVIKDALSNLSFPAWMSLTGEIVPIEGRGRYFASRNFAMGVAGMTTTFLAGLLLTRSAQPGGYQIALLIAFAIGLFSTYSFWRIKDPSPRPGSVGIPAADEAVVLPGVEALSFADSLRDLRAQPQFIIYLGTTAIWNMSINLAAPFFTAFMVQDLNASNAIIGLTSIASTVATMLVQRKIGQINDRWGSHRLQVVSGLLIPFVPMMWVFVTAAWHSIPLNILGGALWGAFNLASFNYLLQLTPPEKRARYSAIFQMTVTLSLAAGAALGSLLVTSFGYHTIFLASGFGRLLSALLFARFSRADKALMQPVGVQS
jgi:MFS family permease